MPRHLAFIPIVALGWFAAGLCQPLLVKAGEETPPQPESGLHVEDLRCEYLCDPTGIDIVRPRLSWILQSDERGQKQTAYQVVVASEPELLSKDNGDLWQSGRVESNQLTQVVYTGKPLASRMRCFWKVRAWDKDGNASAWSQPASWLMGFLKAEDWRARWIHSTAHNARELGALGIAPGGEPIDNVTEKVSLSPWMRKTFVLEAKPERSLAYVNSLGYHELYVNGQKVGSHLLSPAVSDFGARSFYVTYDIAPLLRQGRNCIGLWLGRGWARTAWPVVRLQGEIVAGGKHIEIITDETWKCAPSSYVTLGAWTWNQYGGERYDARCDNPQWCVADYDDRPWANVEIAPTPSCRSESQLCPPNRIGQRIPAVACKELGKDRFELDCGTNLSGWLRMRLPPLTAGQRIAIHYADRHPDGNYNQGARTREYINQVDEFISAGRPHEVFCSKFNYHGFRYAVVEGLPTKPSLDDVEALLIESDLESVGSFACSNEQLNRIYHLNLWTIRCLDLGGYLVDCPHRERFGYGDGQVSAESCLMNLWMPNFYGKWLQDWRDGQDPKTGDLPHVAPRNIGGGGPAWGGALASLTWRMYLYYGDRRVLEDSYDPMRRYVDYLESRCKNDILRTYGGPWDFIGDWVAPGRGIDTNNWPPARANELFNNCYRVYLWELLEQSAAALGREDEVRRCRAKLEQIRPLIHREFYDSANHTYVLEDHPYQCLPLLMRIAPASERNALLRKLEDGILVRRGGHLDSGMLGTYFLIQYLPTIQRDDLLFTAVNQKTYPGWGYMLDQGATTMWEQWNGYWSQIHSCFTSIGGWFHNGLAGIQPDPAASGFKKIIIRPAVVGDLTWVKSSYRSTHGTIVSNWKREKDTFMLDVTIPANATATVYVRTKNLQSVTESGHTAGKVQGVKYLRMENGYAVFAVESGRYSFAAAL